MISQNMISRKRSLQSIYYTSSPPPTQGESPAQNKAKQPKKPVRIVSSIPQKMDLSENPQTFLTKFLASKGITIAVQRFDAVGDLFEEPKQFEVEAYGFEALDAVRTRNIEKLKHFHKEGRPLKCSNRFGESILHLASRKGFHDVVDFLLNTASAPVWVKDDFGRSPLHDACWTVTPNFELMDLLLQEAPDLLYVSDARGHTPLSYARKEHWKKWVDYLEKKGDKLIPRKLVKTPA